MAKIKRAYWVNDCIINSLGFSTEENINNILNYNTNLSLANDTDIACLIDKERLKNELKEYNITNNSLCASIAILALKDRKSGV